MTSLKDSLPKLSRQNKTRIEGAKRISEIIVRKNPVVETALTTKEAYGAIHEIVYGRRKKIRIAGKLIRM